MIETKPVGPKPIYELTVRLAMEKEIKCLAERQT